MIDQGTQNPNALGYSGSPQPPSGYTLDPATGLYVAIDGSTWDPTTGTISGGGAGRNPTGGPGGGPPAAAVIPGTSSGVGIGGGNNIAPSTTTTPSASTTGGGGGNISPVGSLLANWTGQNPANFNPFANSTTTTNYVPPTPQFGAPAVPNIPAFQLPTYAQAANDPGYQFTLGQGEQALQQSAASQGLLNTGGTAKDLINYGQAAGTTQYQNVLDRLLNQYNTNTQTQYVLPYQMAFQNAQGTLAPQMAGYQTQAAAGQYQNQANFQNNLALNNQLFNQYLNQKQFNYGAIAPVLTAP